MIETTFSKVPLGGSFFLIHKNYHGIPVEVEHIKKTSERYCMKDYPDSIVHHVSGNFKVLLRKRLALKVTEIWDDWTGHSEYVSYRSMEWFFQHVNDYGWLSIHPVSKGILELRYCEEGTLRMEYIKP